VEGIQDGNWDTAADRVSSMNQGLCWDAADRLGWGKAPGRAETSTLGTPSLWKSSPHHDLLKEKPALHINPHPIGSWSHYSVGCGISDPLPCSSAPSGPCSTAPLDLPQTPTPQACTISAAPCTSGLPGCNPQSCTISAGTTSLTGLHDLHWATPFSLAKPACHRSAWSLPGLRP
jgi:hypothetical protein